MATLIQIEPSSRCFGGKTMNSNQRTPMSGLKYGRDAGLRDERWPLGTAMKRGFRFKEKKTLPPLPTSSFCSGSVRSFLQHFEEERNVCIIGKCEPESCHPLALPKCVHLSPLHTVKQKIIGSWAAGAGLLLGHTKQPRLCSMQRWMMVFKLRWSVLKPILLKVSCQWLIPND